eukprot:357234-Chlamydomonas_euryale.AAC.9
MPATAPLRCASACQSDVTLKRRMCASGGTRPHVITDLHVIAHPHVITQVRRLVERQFSTTQQGANSTSCSRASCSSDSATGHALPTAAAVHRK